eukprot:Skav236780  [mRNA]  locus=scaffold1361:157539:165157:+ [translate_table: standard]
MRSFALLIFFSLASCSFSEECEASESAAAPALIHVAGSTKKGAQKHIEIPPPPPTQGGGPDSPVYLTTMSETTTSSETNETTTSPEATTTTKSGAATLHFCVQLVVAFLFNLFY